MHDKSVNINKTDIQQLIYYNILNLYLPAEQQL